MFPSTQTHSTHTICCVCSQPSETILVKQMAHAWGSVHKFCSKCKGGRGKSNTFYFKASCLLLQKQPILVPPNKVHVRQVKWADSKGLQYVLHLNQIQTSSWGLRNQTGFTVATLNVGIMCTAQPVHFHELQIYIKKIYIKESNVKAKSSRFKESHRCFLWTALSMSNALDMERWCFDANVLCIWNVMF